MHKTTILALSLFIAQQAFAYYPASQMHQSGLKQVQPYDDKQKYQAVLTINTLNQMLSYYIATRKQFKTLQKTEM